MTSGLKLNQMMNTRFLLLQVFLTCSFLFISAQEMIPLWEKGKMPNSKGLNLSDSVANDRLYQIGSPRVYLYLADKETNTGAAVLIVPGGGYVRLPADYSNVPTARYFQKNGINAFVVCHRLPTSRDLLTPETAPLQDIQRAMRIIYANAQKWGIDTARIGVNGTSAGGHGASTLGTHPEDVSSVGDKLDKFPYKPAFMILVSPVISFDSKIAHKGSREALIGKNPSEELIKSYSNENQVTKYTPPTLLIHADNDTGVSPLNSVVFYQALKAAGVSGSLHIFPFGAHSLNTDKNPGSADMWPAISLAWLKEMKFIN